MDPDYPVFKVETSKSVLKLQIMPLEVEKPYGTGNTTDIKLRPQCSWGTDYELPGNLEHLQAVPLSIPGEKIGFAPGQILHLFPVLSSTLKEVRSNTPLTITQDAEARTPEFRNPKSRKSVSQKHKCQKIKSIEMEFCDAKLAKSKPVKYKLQDADIKIKSQKILVRKCEGFKAETKMIKLPGAKMSESKSSECESLEPMTKGNNVVVTKQRRALPVYCVRERLIEEIGKTDTIIIISETGSGKTTQVPQFIYEAGIALKGKIAITQPRRVAAITLSMRVADEMNCAVIGDLVGYTVRFEDASSPQTKIKFVTDGMLFREAMLDGLLLAYSVIVLDEAHERTVQTDVLFGLVKEAQRKRKILRLHPMKIVIMSATMDVDHFKQYFSDAPVVYIEGRSFPVRVCNAVLPQDDYIFSSLVTVFQIHRDAPADHDILVFLTGQEEIEHAASFLRQLSDDPHGLAPLKVCPLYSSMPSHHQLDVFRPAPLGTRKVILSTNIAETSVTIAGVKYVIDSGKVKARTHQPGTGLDMLKVQQISQAQAWQRTGRAGRDSPGFCFRLYTEEEFKNMPENAVPEIQRCSLGSVVLQLLELGINSLEFDFIDQPPREAIIFALETLLLLGAVNSKENPHLTELGHKMAVFPLDPKFSKIIISAEDYSCVDEILSIVALLSAEPIFVTPPNKREKALDARKKFESPSGDHVTLLNIFRKYSCVKQKKMWCQENFLNADHLEYACQVRKQLAEICVRLNIPCSSCGEDIEQIQKCLVTGFFMNVAEMQRNGVYLTVGSRLCASVHPSSTLFNSKTQWVLYSEMVKTGCSYMRVLSVIDPKWVVDLVPDFALKYHRAFEYYR